MLWQAKVARAEGKVVIAEQAVLAMQSVDDRKEKEKQALMKEMKVENVVLVAEGKQKTLECEEKA